jgi:hypothetical protein
VLGNNFKMLELIKSFGFRISTATRSRPNAVIANGHFTHSREQLERMLLCEINAVAMITLLPPNRTLMPCSLAPRR